MSPSTLVENLFSPISFSTFLRDYFEKKPLLIRAPKKDRFDEVLSMAGIDEILSAGYLRYPEVKMVAGGGDIPTERYLNGDVKGGLIDIEALFSEHAAGATIIINYLHRHWRPLSNFCRELERRLSLAVQANIYLTPRFSQGFDVHYDSHDVIILQIAGEKNWRLYGSPIELPGPELQYRSTAIKVGRVQQKCTLRAGDCLYIPRGYLHDATASAEPSLHITVGLLTSTWGDVLVEAAKMLVRNQAELRHSLPRNYAFGNGSAHDLRSQISRLRRTVALRLPVERAIDEMVDRFISRRPQCLEQHFLDVQQPWLVDASASFVRRDVLFRQSRERDKLCLQFYRKKIFLPRFVAPALKFVTQVEGQFSPTDVPGDLTEDSKVLLCRRLMQEGFLKTAPAAGQPSLQPAKAPRSAKRALRVLKEEHFVVIRQGSGSGGKKPDVD